MTPTPGGTDTGDRQDVRVDLGRIDHLSLLGPNDANLRDLEERFDGTLVVRGQTMIINGPPDQLAIVQDVVSELVERVALGHAIDTVTIGYLWARRTGEQTTEMAEPDDEPILYSSGTRRAVRIRTIRRRCGR